MITFLSSIRRIGIGRIVGLLLLADLLALRIWDPGPIEAFRHKSFDIYQLIHPRTTQRDLVSIVDIDERSLRALGQWPWPRTIMADMVSKIAQQGSIVIGFDVLFPEPDRSSPEVAAETYPGLDQVTLEKLRRLPSNDRIFADAIRSSSVVLGQSGYRVSGSAPTPHPASQSGIATVGFDPRPFLTDFPHLLRNLPILDAAARGHGIYSINPELDGTIRRVPVIALADGVVVPSLALEMLRVTTGAGAALIRTDNSGIRSVGVQSIEIPTDGKGRVWIHFSSSNRDRYISALDLLEGRVQAGKIAGKMVLIGTSAAGLLDLKVTPIDPALPGVEIHAQLLESALTGSTLNRPGYTAVIELALATILGLILIASAPRVNAGTLIVLGGMTTAVTLGLSWYCFTFFHLLIDYTFPLISSFLVYAVLVCTNYVTVSADRYRIRSAFSQYLSPDLVEQLAKTPEKLTLGGEQKVLTVLFSDIRGFTSISEYYKDDPQGLTVLVNRLFTPLTRDIMERHGTIDKYMGDAIMAFWNAPLDDVSHEAHACEAALAMLGSLKQLNEQRQNEATGDKLVPPLNIGIGLNTGLCVVGNFGSDLHFNYSALGDSVNLASRLEGLTKQYGVPIIIGEKTAKAVRNQFAVLEIDYIRVRGKNELERIFTILGRADLASGAEFLTLNARNSAMLTAYRSLEWQRALETILLCKELAKSFGLDDYYDLYIQRIRRQIDVPVSAT